MANGYRVVRVNSLRNGSLQAIPVSRWISKDQAVAFVAGVRVHAPSGEAYGVQSRKGVLSSIAKAV